MTRHFLRSVCRALIGAVLLAQLALSAYACPGMSAVAPSEVGSTTAAAPLTMNCEDMAGPMDAAMDADYPNLCAEHCHQGQQSDQAATLTVPPALLTELYITPPAFQPIAAPRPAAAATRAGAAASPPLAILHCCFRI